MSCIGIENNKEIGRYTDLGKNILTEAEMTEEIDEMLDENLLNNFPQEIKGKMMSDSGTTLTGKVGIADSGEDSRMKCDIPSTAQLEERIDGSHDMFENVMNVDADSDVLTCGQREKDTMEEVNTDQTKRKVISDDENKPKTGDISKKVKGHFGKNDSDNV